MRSDPLSCVRGSHDDKIKFHGNQVSHTSSSHTVIRFHIHTYAYVHLLRCPAVTSRPNVGVPCRWTGSRWRALVCCVLTTHTHTHTHTFTVRGVSVTSCIPKLLFVLRKLTTLSTGAEVCRRETRTLSLSRASWCVPYRVDHSVVRRKMLKPNRRSYDSRAASRRLDGVTPSKLELSAVRG